MSILVSSDPNGLRYALAHVHRSYAGTSQARRRRTGHFQQGWFGAVAMDEHHASKPHQCQFSALSP
jgi:putative transposase